MGRYSEAGRYSFTIKVNDNENNAFYIIRDSEKEQNSVKIEENTENNLADIYYKASSTRKCCGSSVLSNLNLQVFFSEIRL